MRSWKRLAARLLAGLALVTALPACTSAPRAPERELVLGPESPGAVPLEAAMQFRPRPETRHYVVAEGGEGVVVRREATGEHDAQWVDHEDERRSHFWRIDGAGNVITTAVIDYDDNALSVFDPPIVAAFASLAPGETRETTASMRVLDAGNPARQREAGTATQRIRYVGDRAVRTPAGDFDAKAIEIEFTADLRFADATTTRTVYVAPGVGPVLDERREKVVILGLLPKEEQVTLVLERVD